MKHKKITFKKFGYLLDVKLNIKQNDVLILENFNIKKMKITKTYDALGFCNDYSNRPIKTIPIGIKKVKVEILEENLPHVKDISNIIIIIKDDSSDITIKKIIFLNSKGFESINNGNNFLITKNNISL